MKERAPAFQFYPRQFAGDDRVMGMDLEAIGAHILLMCAAAASPARCRIDADEYAIRMRLRNPSDEAWERIKKQLLGGAWKASDDGKWWIQSGLERTFVKQRQFSEEQRKKANKKWGKEDAGTLPDECRTVAERMPDTMPGTCSSSSSSSSKTSSSELQPSSDGASTSTQKKSPSQHACRLAALLKSEILRNKPDYRITQDQVRKWEITAERMLDRDKRTYQQIEKLIRWVQHDEFWMPNVLSMNALREKFDQLELKAGAQGPKAAAVAPLPANYVSASEQILQERSARGMQ